MSDSLLGSSLFAQVSRWERLGDGLHRSRGRIDWIEMLPVAIVLALVAIAIAAIVAIRNRNDMSQKCDDPKKLFRELSLAHQLDRGSQKILWQLAEAFQLAQPAEVFLQPALFHADRLPQELRDEKENLQALHEQLF